MENLKGPLKEYSVVYTDRTVNFMSVNFRKAFKNLSLNLQKVYKAEKSIIMPGSGTYGMEALARQVCKNKKVMVLRLGQFSYRWTQIFDFMNHDQNQIKVAFAESKSQSNGLSQYQLPQFDQLLKEIQEFKPDIFICPHVETSIGLIISNQYLQQISKAVHDLNGTLIVDGIASGSLFINMKDINIDYYITAPQKAWAAPCSTGVIMVQGKGLEIIKNTKSDSFTMDLNKWMTVMDKFEEGLFMYHTTLPTESIGIFDQNVQEYINYGLEKIEKEFIEQGKQVLQLFNKYGYTSIAVENSQSPGVLVFYTDKKDIVQRFSQQGIQIAGGVPLMINEKIDEKYVLFRIGLFGIDKTKNLQQTIDNLEAALKNI